MNKLEVILDKIGKNWVIKCLFDALFVFFLIFKTRNNNFYIRLKDLIYN